MDLSKLSDAELMAIANAADTGKDVAKSAGIGLAKGVIGIAGLPADAAALAGKGLDLIRPGTAETLQRAAQFTPFGGLRGSQTIQKDIEKVTGDFYKPQTTAGEYAQTIGEFAPAAALGPASVARKAAMQVAIPGAASEFAGQQTKGTAYEPYARIGAAIAAPGAAAKTGTALVDAFSVIGPGTGRKSVETAFTSGMKGGEAGQAFRDNMRGNVPLDDVVTEAKGAVSNMRRARGDEYRAGMSGVAADTAVLNFDDIDRAIQQTSSVKKFKGQDLAPETADIRQRVNEAIGQWKGLNPAEYHTAEGMDALKQRLGSIKDSLPYNTPERLVAERAYNAVRDTIVKQAPDYAKVMKGYEQASTQIGEIEKTLSLGKQSSTDTALRKLQSVTRNNVNTNYGKRADLAEVLAESGAPNLMEKLSGQAMNTWAPRGLNKVVAGGSMAGSLINPAALAALPAMSPRLVGEVAHGAGRVAGVVPKTEELVRALIGAKPVGKLTSEQRRLIAALNAEQSVPQ